MKIEFRVRSVVRNLLWAVGFLLVANIGGLICRLGFGRDQVFGLVPLFDFDTEQNVPTLFSSAILGLASFLLYLISAGHKQRGEGHRLWLGLSLVFAFLCIDETAELHERLSKYGHEIFGSEMTFSFGWMIFYEIGLVLLALVYARFLFRLPRKTLIRFILSGLLFVTGALGFETISGRSQELFGSSAPVTKAVFYTCEELLEMCGVVCFIRALLLYAQEIFDLPALMLRPDE